MLGHAASDLIGRSIWEVFPGTVGSEFERVYRAAASARTAASFHAYYPGHDRWYDVNVYPAEGGLSIYFRDITERMKEETLRQALSNLSDLLRNLTTPEDIAMSAAEALGRALGASRVGYATIDANAETLHVVREWHAAGIAPQAEQLSLHDVGLHIDDLKQGKPIVAEGDAASAGTATASVSVPVLERGRLVAIVLRQVKHLTALVDDLVDVSRVTQGLVDIEKVPLDLAPVVDSAIEQVRSFIESRQQQLRVHVAPDPVFVLGDHKRLVQIVTNLLGNATKYTPPGGAIDIKVTATVDTITLSVEDNGIGMATELQSRVFELFTQAKRTSDRSQGGLGIGLALAKSLTEMHGGEISCFSNGEGAGSRFTVTLPKHLPLNGDLPAAPRPAAPWQLPSNEPLRILIVDDNEDAASTLAQYLEAYGHQTFVEHLPGSALLSAALEKPEVCILDIGLPEMDGNELARG